MRNIINIVFPKNVNNEYKGNKIALWVLGLYLLKSFFAGMVHMFASDGGAQIIGSVMLDSFTQGGADSVITVFGLWGMEQFVIGLIILVIVWRYKSLIPFAWLIYTIEYLGRNMIGLFTPGLMTENTPPGAMADTFLVPLAFIMFVIAVYTSMIQHKEERLSVNE